MREIIQKLMNEGDKNKDGKIGFEEFVFVRLVFYVEVTQYVCFFLVHADWLLWFSPSWQDVKTHLSKTGMQQSVCWT